MYLSDAHCDYLWRRLKGKESVFDLNMPQNVEVKNVIFADFEGRQAKKEDVSGQLKIFSDSLPCKGFLAFEGLSWMNGLRDARELVNLKPKYAAPVWNNSNAFGGSCINDRELSLLGRCVLTELSDNGILIDLAHSGEKMFFSCCDNFNSCIFSHGNVYEVCANPRNINTKQIKRLIDMDSFFGISLYNEFIGGKGNIEDLFEHIEAVLNAGGERILGFGTDLDGCSDIVAHGSGYAVFDDILEEALKRNYSTKTIENIFYRNFERVFKYN